MDGGDGTDARPHHAHSGSGEVPLPMRIVKEKCATGLGGSSL
jgi:hypothetical protein